MTTRRRLLVFGLLAVAVVTLAVGVWPRTAITRENAAKIEKGMTLTRVAQILDGSARFEGERFPVMMMGLPPSAEWGTSDLRICVWCDDGERVTHCDIVNNYEGTLDRLRRWLRL